MYIYIVLVSYGSCNKFPQACQIKTREISFQTVLEARNLAVVSLGQNQGVGRAKLTTRCFSGASSWILCATEVETVLPSYLHKVGMMIK